jgi:hypothetical protein
LLEGLVHFGLTGFLHWSKGRYHYEFGCMVGLTGFGLCFKRLEFFSSSGMINYKDLRIDLVFFDRGEKCGAEDIQEAAVYQSTVCLLGPFSNRASFLTQFSSATSV